MDMTEFVNEVNDIVNRLKTLKARVRRKPVHYRLREDMMIATVLDTTKTLLESLVRDLPGK